MNAAKTSKKKNKETGRIAQHYKCAGCGEEYAGSSVQCDHIEPVVSPTKGFNGWDEYIERMFCGPEGLQCLCETCHQLKTLSEKELSKSTKQLKQKKAPSNSRANLAKKK